jgi:hypothetical protein
LGDAEGFLGVHLGKKQAAEEEKSKIFHAFR